MKGKTCANGGSSRARAIIWPAEVKVAALIFPRESDWLGLNFGRFSDRFHPFAGACGGGGVGGGGGGVGVALV